MNNIKNKPSTAELDPAEGSREIIERELRRKGLEEDAEDNGKDVHSPAERPRGAEQRPPKR
jgi:hypothetical protein